MFFSEANFNIVDCEGDIFIGRPVRWNVLKKMKGKLTNIKRFTDYIKKDMLTTIKSVE